MRKTALSDNASLETCARHFVIRCFHASNTSSAIGGCVQVRGAVERLADFKLPETDIYTARKVAYAGTFMFYPDDWQELWKAVHACAELYNLDVALDLSDNTAAVSTADGSVCVRARHADARQALMRACMDMHAQLHPKGYPYVKAGFIYRGVGLSRRVDFGNRRISYTNKLKRALGRHTLNQSTALPPPSMRAKKCGKPKEVRCSK